MSTLKLETHIPKAGVNKPRSRLGLVWHKITSSATEPPFKALPDYHIRVVSIKPGTSQYPLRVKLRTIDPRQAKYTALSYTWDQESTFPPDTSHGPSADTQIILCGGTRVRITQNLYDALCQYRDTQSDVPVFVDQLCINFEDPRERTAYLEIMGHIYARATSVIVWLGKKDQNSDEIMLIMRKLVNAIDWRKMTAGTCHYEFRDPRFFTNIGMEAPTLKQWREIQRFCHLRWFTRYWSFFELALAKNALFLWGEACMEYNFLIDFGMILSMSGWLDDFRVRSSPLDNEGGDGNVHATGLTKMLGPVARLRTVPAWHPMNTEQKGWMMENYGIESAQQRAWKFFEILLESGEAFECRDARDKVFAPLAFVRYVYGGQEMNKQWPRPDYRVDSQEIVQTFSELIYQHTGSPSMLESYFDFAHVHREVKRHESPRGRLARKGDLSGKGGRR